MISLTVAFDSGQRYQALPFKLSINLADAHTLGTRKAISVNSLLRRGGACDQQPVFQQHLPDPLFKEGILSVRY